MSEPFAERYWNLEQVLVWMLLADRRLVRRAAGDDMDARFRVENIRLQDGTIEPRPVDLETHWPVRIDIEIVARGDKTLKTFRQGKAELIRVLEYGRVKCLARKNGEGELTCVPEIQWRDLRFDFPDRRRPRAVPLGVGRSGVAVWCDLTFEREEIQREWPDPMETLVDTEETDASRGAGEPVGESAEAGPEGEDVESAKVDPYRTGGQGRPTVSHLVVAEFERRIGQDLVKPKIAAEAQALRKWVREEHPDGPPMTTRTIENQIRSRYRESQKNRTKTTTK